MNPNYITGYVAVSGALLIWVSHCWSTSTYANRVIKTAIFPIGSFGVGLTIAHILS